MIVQPRSANPFTSRNAFPDSTLASGGVEPAGEFKLDLRYSKTRWSRKVLVGRVIWACISPLFRVLPRPFNRVRAVMLRMMGARIGRACHLEPGIRILMPWNLDFGDHVAVGRGAEFLNFAPVRIGSMSVVSQYTYLCTGTHDYTHPHFPLQYAPIEIGPQTWVAARAFIGPGVTIGEGAVIGAAAVVTRNVPPWMVCAGNPCVPIKPREVRGEAN